MRSKTTQRNSLGRLQVNADQLNDLSKEELQKLKADVDKELERREQERRKTARAEIERIAADAGLSVEELLGARGKKSAGGKKKLPAKYRHPENPELTWVGRGKQPDWFKASLENGMAREDLLIDS